MIEEPKAVPEPPKLRGFHKRPLKERVRLYRESTTASGYVAVLFLAMTVALAAVGLAPAYGWLIASLIGLVVGAGFGWFGVRGLRAAAAVKTWPTVEGTVLETSYGELAEPSRYSVIMHYYPCARFEYQVGLDRFMSDRFSIVPRDYAMIDPKDTREMLALYPQGTRVQVSVSPDDPATAVLHPEISKRRRSHYLALIGAGALIMALSIYLGVPAGG